MLFRALALIGALWLLAGDYLFAYFSSDDFMNLYQSFHKGWAFVRGILLFWSGEVVRPVGGLLYVALYAIFGFHPLPFQLVMLLLLTANLFLAWRVATLVLGDAGLGALAALLVVYHASERGDVWYNLGNFATISDILCFAFMYSAFCVWIKARRGGRWPRLSTFGLIVLLQILALGSKEMAAAFPGLLFVYELFWGNLITKKRIEWRAIPAIGLLAVITVLYLAATIRGPASLLNDSLYRPTFDRHVYFQNMSRYLNLLFYTTHFFRAGRTTLFVAGGLLIALLLRARAMAFGWLLFLISTLPIAFIPGRGISVLYIPALGLAIALTDLLRKVLDAVKAKLPGPARQHVDPAAAPVFVLALVVIVPVHWHFKQIADSVAKAVSAQYRSFVSDLRRQGAPRGSSLLYLRDPFASTRYDPQFIASLIRGDHNLRVGRAKLNQALLSPAVAAMYDDVFDFEGGHLRRVGKRDVPEFVDRLRAQSGLFDPVSGFYLTADGWWWTKKEFVASARCPVAESRCVFVFDLSAPFVDNGESWKISIDVAGIHDRDISLSAGSNAAEVPVALQSSTRPSSVRFLVDHAAPLSKLNGDKRELAIILSGVHVTGTLEGGPAGR